ncbi:hypothetical protein GJW-30_1_02938 [Variibacter gotjawalensis]|jgi:hypothetical protein|uniref:Formate dehydrogenase region TAT target n=1 Tax=Variibacter gotjawalensis TaxID=1333996 RepID=A0A0S3PWU1_9BRAD|nr:twin-arginine translocation signal domain-containing protein [Variibacter gotjawalensis]NIK46228.1 secreted PhoX family phosphatase [Variibacter gotjawalensis]RZS48144.1 secreted protein [Variibacter gotjawalensis]BAT60401.1 hypothetical protein GJW-30_1_02938 [Variibacter gotjawalensis]
MSEKAGKDFGRRDFLRGFGAGAAGAATVVAAPLISTAEAAESDADKKKARYQETPHVKKFYSVNRYPAKK